MTTRTTHEQEAYELGAEHARNAASWVIDGNTSAHHIRALLKGLDDGDPRVDDYLPREPNLSGQWADDPTPQSLSADILGDAGEFRDGGWQYYAGTVEWSERLADAYEEGVSDTFIPECERILRAAVSS